MTQLINRNNNFALFCNLRDCLNQWCAGKTGSVKKKPLICDIHPSTWCEYFYHSDFHGQQWFNNCLAKLLKISQLDLESQLH